MVSVRSDPVIPSRISPSRLGNSFPGKHREGLLSQLRGIEEGGMNANNETTSPDRYRRLCERHAFKKEVDVPRALLSRAFFLPLYANTCIMMYSNDVPISTIEDPYNIYQSLRTWDKSEIRNDVFVSTLYSAIYYIYRSIKRWSELNLYLTGNYIISLYAFRTFHRIFQ